MHDLRVGIIGVGGYGALVLKALAANDLYKIQAIADKDRELAREYAQQYDAQPYDDYRSLIVQEKLDVLFLTIPTFLCGECIALAAKGGMHVFKEAPLARSLPEAMQWHDLMEKAGLRFHVSAPKRFAPGFLQGHHVLAGDPIGKIYLLRAESFSHFQGDFKWRGDPVLAGGGVLLEMAYHMVDQIIWNLGVPERLYSLNTSFCSKRVLPPYRTEDTAILAMKFPDGAMGNLISSWMIGKEHELLSLHGTEGTIEVNQNFLRVHDVKGEIIKQDDYQVDEAWMIAQQLRQLGDSLLDPEVKPVSTAKEHLANVAIIESAYLSARTQLPETLKVYGSLLKLS
jgi:UDP-N-acetyl-2-amino-2-deoxyglucuronate dehydrogenase